MALADLITSTGTPPSAAVGKGDEASTREIERHAPKIRTRPPVPTPDEIRQVGEVSRLFQIARDYRRPMIPRWKECSRMLRNRMWNDARVRSWMPSPMIPEIFPIIDGLVSWEMDQSPTYNIAPAALPHSDFTNYFTNMANDLTTVLQASYQVNAEEIEVAKAQWQKYVFGTGILKTTWDNTLAGGQGDAITRFVPVDAFYPDPMATNIDDGSFYIEAKLMSIQELDRRWPGTAALFPMGGQDYDIDQLPTQLDDGGALTRPRTNPGALVNAGANTYAPPGAGRNRAETEMEMPGVTVLECWIREHESYQSIDASGEPITKVYDTWRVKVVAGNRLIMDEPATNLWNHGGHPYDRLVTRDVGEFWGYSLVEMLISPQKAYNRILAAMQQNAELVGNPVWKDAGNWSKMQLTNKPGTRVPVGAAGAKDSGFVQPPQMNQAHPFLLNHHLERMEVVAGLTQMMKGNAPAGRNAEGVIDAIQETGLVRIRSSLKFLEAALRSAGTKKADLIIENYTTPRIVSMAGPGAERISLALKGHHFMLPTSKGKTPLRYNLLVDVGSSRHTSRAMRDAQEIQFFTLGATDRKALLEGTNYPNADAVAKRMDEREAQMAAIGGQVGPGQRQRARA